MTTSADDVIKLRTLIGDARVTMATSRSATGELHSRPLTLCEIDDTGSLWFIVDHTADWLSTNGAATPTDQSSKPFGINVAVADDSRKVWVSVAGEASVVDDRARVHRLWSPYAQAFFPGGIDDPNVRLLRVRPTSAEYWDAHTKALARLVLLAKGIISGQRTTDLGASGTIDLG